MGISMIRYEGSGEKEDTAHSKREVILMTALHLFTTLGFHATPTSRISKEAGVSTGTLFHYFPDKHTLIDELYLSIKKEMADVVRKPDDALLPIKTRLEKGFFRYIRWGMENPEKVCFIEQFHHSPNISEATQKEAFEEFSWMKDIFILAIHEGVLNNNPVHFHMVMIMRILNGILDLIRSGDPDLTVDEIISAGIKKIWK